MGRDLYNDFIRINISIIMQIDDKVPFDIYIKRAEDKFTKLFHKGNAIDHEQLER